ncbi:MAG: hypothetical protein BWZ10_00365 [candidate division BRC1 bacterium ADurb.BinA364]|nr:MAG: hypothetical protein BWZ10_00365 [candidate division BRC1 bacterium ADurb.BinA364]
MNWSFDTLYLVCFTVGFVYALVAGFFAGVLGGDGGAPHGADVGGDIAGDLNSGDFSGTVHFSPFSPAVIATFLATFGGSGYIYMRMFDMDGTWSVLPALATAFVVGAAVFMIFDYIFKNTQGGVEVNIANLIGREAEVIVSIPADGMGEIAFASGGGRINTPARSETGTAIPKNTIVRISKIVGTVYLVKPAGEEPAERQT